MKIESDEEANMRKVTVLFMVLCATFLMGISVLGTENKIPLTSSEFPEECVRVQLSIFDEDKDGYLSDEELKKITKLEVRKFMDPDDFDDEEGTIEVNRYYKKKDFQFNFKGIGKLKHLTKFSVHLGMGYTKGGKHYASVAKNFKEIYQLKKLTNLELSSIKVKKMEISKLKNLKRFSMSDMPVLKKIVFPKKLTNLYMEGISDLKKIDFTKLKRLKRLEMEGVQCDKLKFGKNKKLKHLSIGYPQSGKEMKSFYIASLKNVEHVYLSNLKTKKLDFSKNKKLKTVFLDYCKIDDVDLSKNMKLKEFNLDGKDTRKVVFAKNNKITWVRWANADLKDFSLKPFNNKYLETVILWGNKLKSVDIRGYEKIRSVCVEDGVKIIKNKNQKLED